MGEYSPVMPTYRTDEDLMIAVRDGDVDQLEVLFERYREPLYDFFGRLTGNRSVSEDLVQDVFVRILKYRTTYREANRFVTWMYQIARNSRIDYLKKHRTETADTTPVIVASTSTPGRQLEESEEKALLQRAMMQLTESNRELLILLRYQEMKYEDRNGLKLKPASGPTEAPHMIPSDAGRLGITIKGTSDLRKLGDFLVAMVGFPVLDGTSDAGTYEYVLKLNIAEGQRGGGNGVRGAGGTGDGGISVTQFDPPVSTALQEQLGLQLDLERVLTEVIVIDQAERLEEN